MDFDYKLYSIIITTIVVGKLIISLVMKIHNGIQYLKLLLDNITDGNISKELYIISSKLDKMQRSNNSNNLVHMIIQQQEKLNTISSKLDKIVTSNIPSEKIIESIKEGAIEGIKDCNQCLNSQC